MPTCFGSLGPVSFQKNERIPGGDVEAVLRVHEDVGADEVTRQIVPKLEGEATAPTADVDQGVAPSQPERNQGTVFKDANLIIRATHDPFHGANAPVRFDKPREQGSI